MIRKLLAAVICALLMPATSPAESPQQVKRSSEPIRIKADRLFTDNVSKTATFTGNVAARQGDITIYGDKLIISYSDENDEISSAEVFGDVRIIQGDRRAQSSHAVYDAKSATIVLDGSNPRVFQNNDTITGKVITYYLDKDRSEVTSGPGERVDAVIHPKNKGRDGKPQTP